MKKRKKEHPKLAKSKMPRVRQEMFDADYVHKLSAEDKAFYGQFISEYYGASIQKINVKVKRKGKKSLTYKKVKAGHLHSTNALAKDCMDANNRRNNDLFGVTRANGLIGNISDESDEWYKDRNLGLSEDALIEYLDDKLKLNKTKA